MVREGLIDPDHYWGTINCNGISPKGELCGVTTTSGLAWKIPGRVGDSPILGAGLYVDGDVGAAGSTGRGEANLYNLSSFLIVEELRRGGHPKDAGMAALKRIKANTVEKRLLDDKGDPNFDVNFYIVDARGRYAGVSIRAATVRGLHRGRPADAPDGAAPVVSADGLVHREPGTDSLSEAGAPHPPCGHPLPGGEGHERTCRGALHRGPASGMIARDVRRGWVDAGGESMREARSRRS